MSVLIKPALKVEHKWPANMPESDIAEFSDQRVYCTYDSYLKKYSDVWLSPDSVIYKNGLLVAGSLASKEHEKYFRFKHLVKKALTGKKVTLSKEKKYLLVTDMWSAGHFHWICDVLPKLISLKEQTKEFILLLPDTPYIASVGRESLSLLQFSFEDVVLMKQNDFYKVKNLYFLSRFSESGHIEPELIQKVRTQFTRHKKPGNEKIYVSRSGAAYRKIINEEELGAMLKNYGFRILNSENLTLAEQVDIFSSAAVLLSIHGAGLANCLFMPADSKVIEIRRKENGPFNVGYWHLVDSLEQQYYYYNALPDSDKSIVGQGCNLTVPVKDFEERIAKNIFQ